MARVETRPDGVTCTIEEYPDKIVKRYSNGITVTRPILPPDEYERRVEEIKRAMARFWIACMKIQKQKEEKEKQQNGS